MFKGQAILLYFMLMALSIFPGVCHAAADQPINSPAAGAPPATCDNIIAHLYQKPICQSDIMPEAEAMAQMRQEYHQQDIDADAAMVAQSRMKLEDLIWSQMLVRKFGANAFAADDQDITRYRSDFKAALAKSYQDNQRIAALIRMLLNQHQYSADNEAKLRQILLASEKTIQFYEQREKHRGEMPVEFQTMVADTEMQIARSMIESWKIDKILYENYGGLVTEKHGRPYPIGAYKAFADDIRAQADLVIHDERYKNLYSQIDAQYEIFQKRREAKDAAPAAAPSPFNNPDWAFPALRTGAGDFEDIADKLRAVPTRD